MPIQPDDGSTTVRDAPSGRTTLRSSPPRAILRQLYQNNIEAAWLNM